VFTTTALQTCIVYLIRNSLDYANWTERKALAAAIKQIYTAPTAEAALNWTPLSRVHGEPDFRCDHCLAPGLGQGEGVSSNIHLVVCSPFNQPP
jgi:hypothetical protein